jgi:hypothetical protein
MLAALGQHDPRLTKTRAQDLQLTRQLTAYSKDDPPPSRNKPVPISVLRQAVDYRILADSWKAKAIADMLLLGFFMLRLGEYAYTDNERATPF